MRPLFVKLIGSPFPSGLTQLMTDPRVLSKLNIQLYFAWDIPKSAARENVLANTMVDYIGQPIAIMVAANRAALETGGALLRWENQPLHTLSHPKEAAALGHQFGSPQAHRFGNPNRIQKKTAHIFQQWLDFVTTTDHPLPGPIIAEPYGVQTIIRLPTVNPAYIQQKVTQLLDIAIDHIVIHPLSYDARLSERIDMQIALAFAAAFVCQRSNRPVIAYPPQSLRDPLLRRHHQIETDIHLDESLKITRYRATCWLNMGGCGADGKYIAEDLLVHGHGAYEIPNAEVKVHLCKTTLPPLNYRPGRGAQIALAMIEFALQNAANKLHVDIEALREHNLLTENEYVPFRGQARNCRLQPAMQQLKTIKRAAAPAFQKNVPLALAAYESMHERQQAKAEASLLTVGTLILRSQLVWYPPPVQQQVKQAVASLLHIAIEDVVFDCPKIYPSMNRLPLPWDRHGKAVLNAVAALKNQIHSAIKNASGDFSLDRIRKNFIHVKHGKKAQQIAIEHLRNRASLEAQGTFGGQRNRGHEGPLIYYHQYGAACFEACETRFDNELRLCVLSVDQGSDFFQGHESAAVAVDETIVVIDRDADPAENITKLRQLLDPPLLLQRSHGLPSKPEPLGVMGTKTTAIESLIPVVACLP